MKRYILTIDTGNEGAIATNFPVSLRDAFLKSKADGSGNPSRLRVSTTDEFLWLHSFNLSRAARFDGLAKTMADSTAELRPPMLCRLLSDVTRGYREAAASKGEPTPLVVFYEDVNFHKSTQQSARAGELRGVILAYGINLDDAGVDSEEVSVLKSWIFKGAPVGTKRDARTAEAWVRRRPELSGEIRNDDEAHAVALYLYYCEKTGLIKG